MSIKKLNFWEFFQSNSSFDYQGKGLLFLTQSPYIEALIKNRLKASAPAFKIAIGNELSPDWLESKFQSLSFFGEEESYIVLFAEGINKRAESRLTELFPPEGNSRLVLCFSKDCPLFKKLSKGENVEAFHFTAPPFWKMEEVVRFLAREEGLSLASDGVRELLERTENEVDALATAMNILKLNSEEGKAIDASFVKEFLTDGSHDVFEFSGLLGSKNFKRFFSRLLEKRLDFDRLREIFSFLERHFLKVLSPEEIKKKTKLNKYDREILAQSDNWSKDEILSLLKSLGYWQILCKKKSPLIYQQLQLNSL